MLLGGEQGIEAPIPVVVHHVAAGHVHVVPSRPYRRRGGGQPYAFGSAHHRTEYPYSPPAVTRHRCLDCVATLIDQNPQVFSAGGWLL